MKVAIIGRTEILYETISLLRSKNHEIVCILTTKEAPEYKCTVDDFKNLAYKLKIPFAQGSKISDFYDFLQTVNADISISINYSGIIPQSIVDLFPLGILNAHGGDLPRYRGNACQSWAIINGEKKVGLCIHKMVGDELDSGDIIERRYFPLSRSTKVGEVLDWMSQQIPGMFLTAAEKIEANPSFVLETQSKDSKDSLRCYPRKPEDGKIDWNEPAENIIRLINASGPPYTGAFTFLDSKKIVILDAELVNSEEIYCAIPGQVTKICVKSIEVACGSDKLRINTIEYKGETLKPNLLISSIRKRLKGE